MRKIVPFKKEIIFKDNLSEITSISLEHIIEIKEKTVFGKFIVSGEYKVSNESTSVEPFSYDLPFEINLDERYILDKAKYEIDDFYYEILNEKVLQVNIDILLDNIEEKEEHVEEKEEHVEEKEEDKRCVEEEKQAETKTVVGDETYQSYIVYIVRAGDKIDTILEKYGIEKELLEEYNDLSELKVGDKIIIPSE